MLNTNLKNKTVEELQALNAPILAKLNNGDLLTQEEWNLHDSILEAATILLDARHAADVAAYEEWASRQ